VAIGFNAALSRLGSKACKGFFGCKGEAKLKSTMYHTYTGGPEGARTDPDHDNVYINLSGAYFHTSSDGYLKLPQQGGNYYLGDCDVSASIHNSS
jgi:hypothetical protein